MMFASLLRYLHAWRRYETAVKELSYLNNHELADLGIARKDIRRVAWESPRNCAGNPKRSSIHGSEFPSDQLDSIAAQPHLTLPAEHE